jgi:hypothetical protein
MSGFVEGLLHLPVLIFLGWLALRRSNGVARRGMRRVFRFLVLVAFAGLAGCASDNELAVAKGPGFALNPGHWQPSDQDLKTIPSDPR